MELTNIPLKLTYDAEGQRCCRSINACFRNGSQVLMMINFEKLRYIIAFLKEYVVLSCSRVKRYLYPCIWLILYFF